MTATPQSSADSVRQARVLPDRTTPSEASEFHLALPEDTRAVLQSHLFPDETHWMDGMFERGVIGLITPSTGRNRTTYLLQNIVEPRPGDVYMENGSVYFDTDYRIRATQAAKQVPGAGLVFIHTHPGSSARPSGDDLDADREELFAAGKHLGPDVPLAAAIVPEHPEDVDDRTWSVRAYEFNIPRTPQEARDPAYGEKSATITHATAVRVVGQRLKKLRTIRDAHGAAGVGGEPDPEAQDSTVELWGERGQTTLAGLRVGVTGLGGVGSLLAEQIARLGVGETVFVDFDHIERENLNRAYGATPRDARNHERKIEVGARIAETAATAPDFGVRTVYGSVVEDEDPEYAAVPDLLDCDLIINAADAHWVRYVLDEVAYAHLVPVLDGGTSLAVDEDRDELATQAGSRVGVAGPGHPCLECLGHWFEGDHEEGVTADRNRPENRGDLLYVEGADPDAQPRAPSVISNNGLVASLLMLRMQALVLGITSEGVVGGQEYDARRGTVSWKSVAGDTQTACFGTVCDRPEATARGDHYELPTGYDWDLRRALDADSPDTDCASDTQTDPEASAATETDDVTTSTATSAETTTRSSWLSRVVEKLRSLF